MQLLSQRAAAHTTGSAVHHRLHAEAAGRPGSDQRLEVRGDGGGQVLPDRVHVFHFGRHRCRTVFSTTHNRRVTGGSFLERRTDRRGLVKYYIYFGKYHCVSEYLNRKCIIIIFFL